ncbi:hypothetical protein LP7551_05287 [Roseibium album]|nr:hypothetical protein LP7551_05287 [Roseibium album]
MSASPLDQVISARNAAKKNPHPDPVTAARQKQRAVPVCPLDISPEAIMGDVVALEGARNAMKTVRDCWNAIREAAIETEDVRKLAKDGTRLTERATMAVDAARGRLEDAEKALEQQIQQRVTVPVAPHLQSEIRAAVHGRDDITLLVRNEPAVASAILSAPAFLSGLDSKKQDSLRNIAIQSHAKEEMARLKQVRRAKNQVDRAGGMVLTKLDTKVAKWAQEEPGAVTRMRNMANA